ncbi:hypothetical protein C8F04DRAFT_1141408 [Mycena alexandri]|uniref:UBC core domain-containing protein n=1 Tax=Mycena alexandri TaxID=1745969 RepID=A0AAD6WQD4_9AGAR|nr:hypothetical protein C8F04DRAFT_1141408 [Mycena alexandri]
MPQKRRILVAFEEDLLVSDASQAQKRQRKIAVSIDPTATNAELAKEIAATLHRPNVILEIAGGFELRDQDGVEMIGDNDIVTARLTDATPIPIPRIYDTLPPKPAEKPTRASDGVPDAVDRFKIVFVTAEHAVAHAKQTPKYQTEPTNGVLAFEGEPINGATTLRDLKKEAARALQWTSPNAMDVDDDDGRAEEAAPAACSCHVGQEIERHGLSSTLHCRFTLDGSSCSDPECPYSHVALTDSNIVGAPHCSICTDALAFPCPPCLARAENRGEEPASVRFCPLVQNASCGHLHHAHCVGPRTASISCPSGCAVARFPREAADFQDFKPHLVLTWDGDKIDRIPIPFHMDGVSRVEATTIVSTDAVMMLVESFLQDRGFVRSELLLRVHSRDAVTESVKFVRSTLVSVCPSSSHLNQAHRRFALFPTHTVPLPRSCRGGTSVDLHTSHAPIIADSGTQIKQLFPSTGGTIVLYVVKRTMDDAALTVPDKVSKQSMYLADSAWQPRVPQTPRGIAALLSSLYLFAHSVSQKGGTGEERVLAQAFSVLRFPPAIRTLAGLLLNKVPQPEEKAALSAALFHAVGEFSWRGPAAITTRDTRRFETVRILLAYIASAANEDSQVLYKSPVEEISLICALSRKRLRDPVLVNSVSIERTVANLNQPGGPLYRPTHSALPFPVIEISATDVVRQLLPRLNGLPSVSTLLLRVENIAAAPPTMMAPLDSVARDFVAAIKRANLGDLVTQGPLELKSVDVVPPRIVVDQEGRLAVFTGRGCGTTRDVNFFRPANGGDTEVDVNDVSHALQKVTETRKAEDTWQVDCFGEVSAISRPPDEAIVLCLDLSESMNRASGVQKSGHRAPDATPAFDPQAETNKVVADLLTNMRHQDIMIKAKAHLESQHTSCHRPWATLMARNDPPSADLLHRLSVLASRDLLRLVFSLEDQGDNPQDPLVRASMLQLACFVFAATYPTLREQLQSLLIGLITDSAAELSVGEEPYDVPRKFLDFRTGELLVDPVHPDHAPSRVYVNRTTAVWYNHRPWPLGHSVSANMTAPQLKKAVMAWVAGADLLPKFKKNSKAPSIVLTLEHRDEKTTWKLSPDTTTRTLYALANRATRGMYSEFTLRTCASQVIITDGTDLTLSGTDLVDNSVMEMLGCEPHTRQTCDLEITVEGGRSPQRLVVPKDASLLAVLSYIDDSNPEVPNLRITDMRLWYGLNDFGDGLYRGHPVDTDDDLAARIDTSSVPSLNLECCFTDGVPLQGARAAREDSKTLTRLHLLKELFHVFLNRAGSFDTTVSLVLGLVTFSEQALVTQELTPIFEAFRQSLDRTTASGNTAVYDALDSARRVLTGYRPDLPNLRKRIVIVSDGEDTSSATSAREVCLALQRARVVVDSVQVGKRSDPVLHAISVATGGYRFAPKTSLADALSIFDLETMLHSGDRPPRARMPFVMSENQLESYQNKHTYPVDLITVDKFPPRAEHPLLKKPVKSAASSMGLVGAGDDRTRRIMREIKNIVSDPHPNIDVYFNDQDMSFLKVILEAPTDLPNCPYVGGTFLLTVNLPAGYPRDPPEVRFVTFILHPNVSKQGKVCIAELGRLWSSDITLKEIFSLVYGTLLEPDLENPLEIQASLKYYEDDGTYALAVADAISAHASKTRAQWREELGE